MKWLFFLLCLMNAGYLFWQFHNGRLDIQLETTAQSSSVLILEEYLRAQRGAEISGWIDTQVEQRMNQWRLVDIQRTVFNLTAEKRWWRMPFARPKPKKVVKPTVVVKKIVEPVKPAAPVVKSKCYEVGPFDDELSAKQWLDDQALESKEIVRKENAVPTDYQVYYPAAKTPEQSKLDKAMLYDNGIKDVWKIPAGELEGAFSVGVFTDDERANVLKEELAQKGVKVLVMQREKTLTKWFGRVKLDKAKLKDYQSEAIEFSLCASD